MGQKVGVLVVDDSPLCQELIAAALKQDPDLEIVGTAKDGLEAVEQVKRLRPNVITMDVDMPVLDGLGAVERIMADVPTPILVLTADPRSQAPELTCRALELGALALQVKPALDIDPDAWELAREVKLLAQVRVIRHLRGLKKGAAPPAPTPEAPTPARTTSIGFVGIVGSTGAPQVLHRLINQLPEDFPAPIAIVQHINPDFAESMAGWLRAGSKLKVALARDGDVLAPGQVYLAPPGKHLVVASRGRLGLRPGPPRDGHMPSGSELLESAAKVYGGRAAGMILSGMGEDGAAGMLAIRTAGGTTFAQSEGTCVVFGMPGAAVARRAVDRVVDADGLAKALLDLVRPGDKPAAR